MVKFEELPICANNLRLINKSSLKSVIIIRDRGYEKYVENPVYYEADVLYVLYKNGDFYQIHKGVPKYYYSVRRIDSIYMNKENSQRIFIRFLDRSIPDREISFFDTNFSKIVPIPTVYGK